MTPQTELELQGNFLAHPFSELAAEIMHARLTGSLRVSDQDRKCILYFTDGRLDFGVSNERTSRLFYILTERKRIGRDDLAQIPDFQNDFALSSFLQANGLLTKVESTELFTYQIKSMFVNILSWPEGTWTFSPLARVRDGLKFEVDAAGILLDYARCLSPESVLARFRTLKERFERAETADANVTLSPEEIHILTRFSDHEVSIADLTKLADIPESATIRSLYSLWLGGFLLRSGWQAAFSPASIEKILGAKLELKREAEHLVPSKPSTPAPQPSVPTSPIATPVKSAPALSLDEYLARVENSVTHYDVLGVDHKVEQPDVRRAYFSLAKQFHPDHFHQEGRETLRRVQIAFTALSKAHEELKTEDFRENYDFKMRKELAEKEKTKARAEGDTIDVKVQQASENFDRGFSLLMDKEYEAALPFLARAVHFAPNMARYHAYFGKALSADSTQRHKAESEMQAALRLDPDNATYRIILVEFFIQINLLKRAEGELTRMLAKFPTNREARDLLDRLQK